MVWSNEKHVRFVLKHVNPFNYYSFKCYSPICVHCIDKINAAGPLWSQRARQHVKKRDNRLGPTIEATNVPCAQSGLVYLVLRAECLSGRPGPFFHPCRSLRTGSGPLLDLLNPLCCKKALWGEKSSMGLYLTGILYSFSISKINPMQR